MRLGGHRLPMKRLSATALSMFANCPEQFRQRYVLHKKEAMSGERFVGSVTHQALDAMIGDSTMDPGIAVEQAWQGVIEKEGDPEWYDVDAADQYRRAKQMVKTYQVVAEQVAPLVVSSENHFEEQIAGVTVQGYIDRTLTNRILEVKTASAKVSKPKPRWSFQGRLYTLVSDLPIEWHVVTRQVTPKVYTAAECPDLYVQGFNKDATVQIVKQAVEYMNDLYARYGAEHPWPLNGIYGDWTCNYCSFKKGCPAWT